MHYGDRVAEPAVSSLANLGPEADTAFRVRLGANSLDPDSALARSHGDC